MTAPILWPIALPFRGQPQAMNGQHVNSRLSFQPQSGAPIERPRTTSAIQSFDMTITLMTKDQFSAFSTFYNDTLSRGTQYFGWIHPRSLEIRRVKIASDPVENHVGLDYWRPSFTLLVHDFVPSWASYLTTINGYMQIVDQPAWDAL